MYKYELSVTYLDLKCQGQIIKKKFDSLYAKMNAEYHFVSFAHSTSSCRLL